MVDKSGNKSNKIRGHPVTNVYHSRSNTNRSFTCWRGNHNRCSNTQNVCECPCHKESA